MKCPERWLKNYIKDLDPLKVYFTQADIDEFEQHKDDLDDWAKQQRRSAHSVRPFDLSAVFGSARPTREDGRRIGERKTRLLGR